MIPKFNPGFQTDQEAIDNFVVRQFQFEQIVDTIANAGLVAPRFLISAPRGAGKTTLCRRVVAEVRTRPELAKDWQPIFLGEESYSVTTPGEFLLEVLLQLNDQAPEGGLQSSLDRATAATSERDLVGRAMGALRSYSQAVGRRLLVVVENLHIILIDQLEEASTGTGLLGLLADGSLFGVLATSLTNASGGPDSGLPTDYAAIELRPLTLNECKALWLALTHEDVAAEKIRPIQILTGGSPRLIHILADFMKTRSLRDLMENLNFLIDQNTEYFKSQLDALPTIERKVFAALLEIWDPSTATQVAEAARVNTNTASAMLARLAHRGAVVKEPGQGRTAIYFAAERLFNIYYLMRRRSHPSSRVKALVTFMVEFYSREELVDTTALLAREACDVEPSRRGDYHSTFDAILAKSSESVRDEILKSTPKEFILSFRQAQKESRQVTSLTETPPASKSDSRLSELINRIEASADDGHIEAAKDLINEALELAPDLPELWMRLAYVDNELGHFSEAVTAARKAVTLEPDDPWTHTVLALALTSNDLNDEALAEYEAALLLEPGHEPALVAAAAYAERAENQTKAAALYKAANEADALTELSRVLYAQLLSRMERPAEAEALLREASSDFDNHVVRRALASFLHHHDRSEEAQRLLENLAEREVRWESFAELGRYFLTEAENGPAARDALRTAIEMGADDPLIYSRLARAMIAAQNPTDEVAAVALQMVSKYADSAKAWIFAGRIYESLDEDAEAEAAYRSATEREDGHHGLVALARLLERKVGRHNEAEALLRQAVGIEVGRSKCAPLRHLAEFLIHNGQDDEAETVLQEAIVSNSRCACCFALQGDLYQRRGQIQAAEEGYRSALKIYSGDVRALTGLARVVDRQEAGKLIKQALRSAPGDPRAAFASIQLDRQDQNQQIIDARTLVGASPSFLEARLFLASLEAQAGNLGGSIEQLSTVMVDLPSRRDLIPRFVATAMGVAEAGGSEELRELLATHQNRNTLEPLAVAVELKSGRTPLVAKEVLDVARDIVTRTTPAP